MTFDAQQDREYKNREVDQRNESDLKRCNENKTAEKERDIRKREIEIEMLFQGRQIQH